jgi:hypothetical protein
MVGDELTADRRVGGDELVREAERGRHPRSLPRASRALQSVDTLCQAEGVITRLADVLAGDAPLVLPGVYDGPRALLARHAGYVLAFDDMNALVGVGHRDRWPVA